MSDCEHGNTEVRKESRMAFGHEFQWETSVCKDCDAVLWDTDTKLKYNAWLAEIFKKDRDQFLIQFGLPAGAVSCLEAISIHFPSVDESSLMRALVAVYLAVVPQDPKVAKAIESICTTQEFLRINSGSRSPKKLRFKPRAYLALHGLSELFDVPLSKLSEDIVLRMLALAVENDPELKKIWEEIFASRLEAALNAA